MKKTGYADLPLHGGKVPYWLAQRMQLLGGAIAEVIVQEYGQQGFLSRLSDPKWFQAFGCVLGMDWHSSGITTSVMGALKKSLNIKYDDVGIWICGGRGKYSLNTPTELLEFGERNGQDGIELARKSRLSAKVDNTAIQDGYQLYLHNFIVTSKGDWAVVQQGMDQKSGMARRYHWHSLKVAIFTEEPHTAITGTCQGKLLNLTDRKAAPAKDKILSMVKEEHPALHRDIKKLVMPLRHDVRASDVNIKQLGAVLALAKETVPDDFDSFLLTPGLGPRTLQSLALVSEIIYGTPSRFEDPARFSFAHGGKDGHPFPVPLKVYDQSISFMKKSILAAKIDPSEKNRSIKRLHDMALDIEKRFSPKAENFNKYIRKERELSHRYGGMTIHGPVKSTGQLNLFG